MKKPSDHAADLCGLIESIPASSEQTAASIKAATLRQMLYDLETKGKAFTDGVTEIMEANEPTA
jgi:hypothetical protein